MTGIAAVLVLGAGPAVASSAVTVQSTAGATSLELDGRGGASTHIVKIAEVSLTTDAAAGLAAAITSGSLTKVDGSTPVPFRVVLVDRDASPPPSSAFTTPPGTPYLFSTSAAGSVEKDAYIKYTPGALQDPGSYAASVEIDVVDN
jgi:hypothetical protein